MADQNSQPRQVTDSGAQSEALNAGRRKLVRAGLAAAPVVAAFKSNMVLAQTSSGGQGTTVRASSFASFKENGALTCSGAPANSLGRYLTMDQVKSHPQLTSLRFNSNNHPSLGFSRSIEPSCNEKTLDKIFKADDLQPGERRDLRRLAQFCVAAYLSAQTYGVDSFMSKSQAHTIWKSKGVWSPSAGIQWGLSDTMQYFERVYETQFDACFREGQLVQNDQIKSDSGASDQRLS